jgi:hypothetical protein
MELGTRRDGNGHEGLDWFRPLESKTLRPVCIGIMWREIYPRGGSRRHGDDALKGHPMPPYIGGRALGYKSVSIYSSLLQ